MSTVDVSSESLRDQGAALNEAREEMVDDKYFVQLDGMGNHTRLSPGQFQAGMACQMRLDSHVARMREVFAAFQINIIGLSSALHIVADIYGEEDMENAFRFAFVDPEAAVPKNLALGVDPNSSFLNPPEADDDSSDNEDPIVIPQEAQSSLVPREWSSGSTGMPYGAPTYNYAETIRPDGTRIVRTEVIYADGRTDYYTSIYHPDGTTERTDEMSFGPQGRPADWGDVGSWLRDETDSMTQHPERAPEPPPEPEPAEQPDEVILAPGPLGGDPAGSTGTHV